MSTASFPVLPGLAWPVKRTPIWQTRQQDSVSGKKVSIADWSTPKHRWSLVYNFLRGDTPTHVELQALEGFFGARFGSFDSFLYNDPRDNGVALSTLGTGDSTARGFQLIRPYGASSVATFSEPIYAPTSISAVTVGSTAISSTQWSFSLWGTTAPGVLTFSTFAPTAGQAVVASFGYSWPVSFDNDTLDFEEFVKQIWGLKSISFTSLK